MTTEKSVVDNKHGSETSSLLPPRDRYDAVYWSAFYVGIVLYLPWNVLTAVSGYWDYKYRDVGLDGSPEEQAEELTKYQKEWTSYLSIASNVPSAIFTVLHMLVGHRFPMDRRILVAEAGALVVFLGVIVLAALDSDDWQQAFLVANLVIVVLFNAFNGVFKSSFNSSLGPFPAEYLGICATGAGLSGAIASLINILVLAADADPQAAGFWSFAVTEAAAAACLALIVALMRGNSFYRHHTTQEQEHRSGQGELKPPTTWRQDLDVFGEILRDAWMYLAAVFINFATTLCVYPAVAVLVEPVDPEDDDWNEIFFVPVCCFLLYGLADFAGKWAATRLRWPGPSRAGQAGVLAAAVARIALVPLIMYCNVAPSDRTTPVVFDSSDGYYLAFLTLLGLSNGYVGAIPTMFVAKAVRPELQEVATAVCVTAIVAGLGVGSLVSTPVVRLL